MSKPRYELSAAARFDLLQTWNYLAEQATLDVADKVVADIESAIVRIVRTPGIGHARTDLTARDLLFYRVHCYLIVYRADTKPLLHVIRILHAARDVKGMLQE